MRRPTKSPFHRPAMQTLERLHSELGGQILENKEEAQRLAGQMLHVEAVIKMLDPTYNLRRISVKRRTANPWFKGHHLPSRRGRAQDGHRADDGPGYRRTGLSGGQYANIKRPDNDALADLTGSILASPRNYIGKGIQRTNEGAPAPVAP
jgi:hypothetical protein